MRISDLPECPVILITRPDVVDQIKDLASSSEGLLTVDERNLLSIAYKNLTSNLRNAWRTIDTLEKKGGHTQRQISLMRVEKQRIRDELVRACKDVVDLMDSQLIPFASPGEEKVFYSKM